MAISRQKTRAVWAKRVEAFERSGEWRREWCAASGVSARKGVREKLSGTIALLRSTAPLQTPTSDIPGVALQRALDGACQPTGRVSQERAARATAGIGFTVRNGCGDRAQGALLQTQRAPRQRANRDSHRSTGPEPTVDACPCRRLLSAATATSPRNRLSLVIVEASIIVRPQLFDHADKAAHAFLRCQRRVGAAHFGLHPARVQHGEHEALRAEF